MSHIGAEMDDSTAPEKHIGSWKELMMRGLVDEDTSGAGAPVQLGRARSWRRHASRRSSRSGGTSATSRERKTAHIVAPCGLMAPDREHGRGMELRRRTLCEHRQRRRLRRERGRGDVRAAGSHGLSAAVSEWPRLVAVSGTSAGTEMHVPRDARGPHAEEEFQSEGKGGEENIAFVEVASPVLT
eukprot:CAMPEP_0203997170 /NCGR_PEP_ID=MMETSP0360-20130528/13211_1 /ASSEMBLY_ACC=CAM_ASM_000342 /TAXON_ID=268821 /ORGANISM="Scrippsiella Hangoei, Strain SHTV-5" /LENGTH=184 /DNA_ID=CAMNT_0050938069 /DNA_START=187 /DNA_END=739 /DNA_ORIENTATION=+